MQEYIPRLLSLFSGNERNYGVFGPGLVPDPQELKKFRPSWVNWEQGAPTGLQWEQHLKAEKGIGIVPIRDDNKVKFMAIDLDVQAMESLGLSLEDVAASIEEHKLPFVVCRSKSGAAHIYLFFTHFVDAKKVREKMSDIADFLGYRVNGTLPEIYPRTSFISIEDMGSYINMPYFGGEESLRYALAPNGSKMSIQVFLARAEYLQTTAKAFLGWEAPSSIESRVQEIVSRGPCCLQTLYGTGVPEGQRNTVMLQFFLLFSKTNGSEMEDLLGYVNHHCFKPPMPAREIAIMVKSAKAKDYNYNCSSSCFADICQKQTCQLREYGVGGGMAFPAIKRVVQYGAGSDRFELELEMGRILKVTSEEFLDWKKMRQMVLHTTLQVMPAPKKGTWEPFVSAIMTRMEVVKLQDAFEIESQIRGVIQSYITSKTVSNRLDDLLSNRPVKVKMEEKGNVIIIPHDALSKMIRDKKFVDYKPRDEFPVLNTMGAWSDSIEIKGRQISIWRIPEPSFNAKDILDSLSSDFVPEL